jgi:dipeptidyl aminopeptidase/acylaminoacyl peptidase
MFHLFHEDAEGNLTELTEGENTREMFYGFSHDRQSFFTGNNSRDQRYMDVYEWDIETLTPELFYENKDGLNLTGLSRDKRYLALVKTNNHFDSDLYIVDRERGNEPKLMREMEGEVNQMPATFTPDSSALLYLTDHESDWLYLMRYDLKTGEHTEVLRPGRWDVNDVRYSHNGTWRVININRESAPDLTIENMETGEIFDQSGLLEGNISGIGISDSESKMRFTVWDDDNPSNMYVYNMESEELTQLTDNLNPEINAEHLVDSEFISLTARDGLEFSGYLYKPKMATPEAKVPALLWIHGGPGGQSRPIYSAEKQFMVNHGYAVFDLNYRGSSGFGRAFSMADDQKHGKEPLYDTIDAKNYLIENVDWVDSKKIGILGGSYGGYMTMAALAFTPEEFEVGVNIFGVTNWVRTLKSIPPWWESEREGLYREIGNPETQEEMLYEISPLFHAENITKPVIVLQGANDPRVLQVESDEMVENIRDAGGIVRYVFFEDEGHGFTKNENRIEGWNAILEFLNQHLKGVTPEEATPEGAEEEATETNEEPAQTTEE